MTDSRVISLRSIVIPTEHGGWGFTLEPVLLGLLVAPGVAGVMLAVTALALFLCRRPLRMAWTDRRMGRHFPRTVLAERVSLVLLAIAGAGMAVAALTARGPFWWPLAAAAPSAVLQVWADATRRSRHLLPEIAGAGSLGGFATAIALADGWAAVPAFGLWWVLLARTVASVILVRVLLRRVKGDRSPAAAVHGAHALAVAALGSLAVTDVIPFPAAASLAVLWVGAWAVLRHPPGAARTVGWTQIAAGLLVVALTAAGHHLGW